MDALTGIVREMLVDVVVLCFPVLLVATAIGTIVAIAQAATQVQEQTLTLLPKMIAVGATLALGSAFGFRLCAALFEDAIRAVPQIVRGGA